MADKNHSENVDVKQQKHQRFWAWFVVFGWLYFIFKVIVFSIQHWATLVTVLVSLGLLLCSPLLLLLFAGGGPAPGEDGNFEEQADLPFVEDYNDWGTYLEDLNNDFQDDAGDDLDGDGDFGGDDD